MPNCVECELYVPDINDLRLHLQLNHKTDFSKAIKCKEKGCFRDVSNWGDYRRHLRKIHRYNFKGKMCDNSDQFEVFGNDVSGVVQAGDNISLESADSVKANNFIHSANLDLKSEISKVLFFFVCKLYATPKLPRSHVQEVLEGVEYMLSGIFSVFSKVFGKEMVDAGLSNDVVEKLLSMMDCWQEPFSKMSSEYKRFKFIKESGLMLFPEPFIVGHLAGEKRKGNLLVKDMIPFSAQMIPLRKLLKLVFELPNVLDLTLGYYNKLMEEMESGIISNVVQGKLWLDKVASHFHRKVVLPLNIYYDDFEINNPLGSHKGIQKLGGVYFSVACFPPEFRSKVENIFLTLLFHSSDRSIFKNVSIFHKLIDELNFLQTDGIVLKTATGFQTVHFSLAHLLGDNLGLNSALGFVEAFQANYFCRICKTRRCLTQVDTRERASLIRTPQQYDADVSAGVESTGVKESSVWNNVMYFHAVSNFVVDISHDLLEGVYRYDMGHIIHYFVYNLPEAEALSLDVLNYRGA